MSKFYLASIDKNNYEEAIRLTEHDHSYVSVVHGLAYAYIKPWDEALDPYVVMLDDLIIGFVYVSYTPHSEDNYWIGGLYIKSEYRHQGYGRKTIEWVIDMIQRNHKECHTVRLTVEEENTVAKSLYEHMGFMTDQERNAYGEIRYYLPINRG